MEFGAADLAALAALLSGLDAFARSASCRVAHHLIA
jgi:hypothetical protein